jgi:hypothetical protein
MKKSSVVPYEANRWWVRVAVLVTVVSSGSGFCLSACSRTQSTTSTVAASTSVTANSCTTDSLNALTTLLADPANNSSLLLQYALKYGTSSHIFEVISSTFTDVYQSLYINGYTTALHQADLEIVNQCAQSATSSSSVNPTTSPEPSGAPTTTLEPTTSSTSQGSYDSFTAIAPCIDSQTSPTVRPSTLLLACATGNIAVYNIQWTSWTDRMALGRGRLSVNGCDPDCAEGHFVNYPNSTIEVSDPVSLDGGRVFQDVRVTPMAPAVPESSSSPGGWGSY